jgi:hypothetical protein
MGYNFFENFFVLCHAAKVAKICKLTRERGEGDKGTRRMGDTEKFSFTKSSTFAE